jgi:hypothetical protein
MSYAYLFKYIIIGDTGILLLLLLSSRVYVCMCARVCVIFIWNQNFFESALFCGFVSTTLCVPIWSWTSWNLFFLLECVLAILGSEF